MFYNSTRNSDVKVNSAVLNAEEFRDTDVEQGQDYYYYLK